MESADASILVWPFLVYTGVALAIVAGMLLLSYFLGQHHHNQSTSDPYESGILNTGNARVRFSAQFYIVAMFFVIFDLEVAFLIAWAVSLRELGWTGYFGMLIFVGMLAAVFVYEWRIGALDFGPDGGKILKALRKRKKEQTTAQVKEQRKTKEQVTSQAESY